MISLDPRALVAVVADICRRDPDLRRELRDALGLDDGAAELVTVASYAAARSISESTVRKAISEDRLPIEKVGARSVRIRRDATIAPRRHSTTLKLLDEKRLGIAGGGR